jgi:hypothetical protein
MRDHIPDRTREKMPTCKAIVSLPQGTRTLSAPLLWKKPERSPRILDLQMGKTPERSTPLKNKKSRGAHGGNRGGERTRAVKQLKKSSQAAGKDPARGNR